MSSPPTLASSTPSSGCGETRSGSKSRKRLSSLRSLVRAIADGIIAGVLAPTCTACDMPLPEPGRGPICSACWARIPEFTPPLCERCGDPLPSWRVISIAAALCPRCRRRPTAVTRSRAIGAYDGALRSILHAFKYEGCRSLARGLGERMRRAGAAALEGCHVVVPVPLHRRRQRTRGFNQAEELARHLGPPVVLALRRCRATASQTGLPAGRRHANVRNAFVMRRSCDVRGLRIVIVDDVSTTGATVEACARVLRAAGAADVSVLTAARVVSRRPE